MSMFDTFEDEDCWLTPSREVGTQSEKFDIRTFLGEVKLSENASALSKKIAKAQQKRALKAKKLETLTEAREKSASPIRDLTEMGAANSTPCRPFLPERLAKTVFGDVEQKTSTPLSKWSPSVLMSNVSPILTMSQTDSFGYSADDDEDFQDATDQFSPEAMERISMSASFSTIEALLTREDDYFGQSLIRAPMSQSLVKVEEEEMPRGEITFDSSPRNLRSSSVSPRPLQPNSNSSTPTSNLLLIKNNKEEQQLRFTARNGMERRSLGSATLLRSARSQSRTPSTVGFSTPNGRQSRPMRSAKATPPKGPTSHLTPSIKTEESPLVRPSLNLHADLATLEDLTRRQEELLRQEVMMQQQAERKSSWQGDTGSVSSPNSSMTSLASSKSVDIASINMGSSALPPSKLRPPSKLPRPSSHFTPARVPASTRSSTLAKSGASANNDDECF